MGSAAGLSEGLRGGLVEMFLGSGSEDLAEGKGDQQDEEGDLKELHLGDVCWLLEVFKFVKRNV